jgi:hypothetical protein
LEAPHLAPPTPERRLEMGNRQWKCWMVAAILAAGLWAAACSSKAEEKAQPKAFNSAVAFDVYAVIGEEDQLVGRTPSERPLTIPPCQWWYVAPLRPVDVGKVRQEVEERAHSRRRGVPAETAHAVIARSRHGNA